MIKSNYILYIISNIMDNAFIGYFIFIAYYMLQVVLKITL